MTMRWQVVMGYVPYDEETEVRPGKWNFTDLLDLKDDCYFTDDGVVYDTLQDADDELERRVKKLKTP